MDINQRLERLASRRTDPTIFEATKGMESYRTLAAPDGVRYVIGAMQPIDPVYTRNSFAEGDRVKNQLINRLVGSFDYRYQGSVTTDTHIRAHSDIDLLVLFKLWWFCRPPLQPKFPYEGDPKQDIRVLRNDSADHLEVAYPEAKVDSSGSRSISLEGGSLRRKVDVVPATWLHTVEYEESGNEVFRGVKVLNVSSALFSENFPFLNVAQIDLKDRRVGGGMRKAARLMKTIKADADDVDLSSYDITAIAWNIPDQDLAAGPPWEMKIFAACLGYLRTIVRSQTIRESLWVPDGSRRVFESGHATVEAASALLAHLESIAGTLPIFDSIGRKIALSEIKIDRPYIIAS